MEVSAIDITTYIQFGALGVLAAVLGWQSKGQAKRDKAQAKFLDRFFESQNSTQGRLLEVIERNATANAGTAEALHSIGEIISSCE